MDLALVSLDAFCGPSFVFKYDLLRKQAEQAVETSHNPPERTAENRASTVDNSFSVDAVGQKTFVMAGTTQWRIDGANKDGKQYFAVPLSLIEQLVPLRIDVFVASQRDVDPPLLGLPSPDTNPTLPHSLCQALDNYCERNPDFLNRYQTLPFGSKLVFESISTDVSNMVLTVLPAHHLERQSLSVTSLKKLWEVEMHGKQWPKTIDLGRLRLFRQLHDTISIVRTVDCQHSQELIFKSSTKDFIHLYHELEFLLTNPPHPNIISSPFHLVTKQVRFGGKRGVVGFTLPFYPLGSLRDILPVRRQSGNLPFPTRVRWARQITSALIHIHEEAGTFYSDLRPDNILLRTSQSQDGDVEDIILCDFEQRGNWHEWCAPEILYRQYIESLRANLPSDLPVPDRWLSLIDAYSRRQVPQPEGLIQSRNRAWFALSPASQEKAQVYNLGLFLYCLFEGVSNVCISAANVIPHQPDVEFPEFKRCPPAVQDIIERCTVDAPEWEQDRRHKSTARRIDNIVLQAMADTDYDDGERVKRLVDAAMAWWTSELDRAEKFLESEEWHSGEFGRMRPTLREVMTMLESI